MINSLLQINDWGWENCSIVKIGNDENKQEVSILCEEFIGFEFIGNWHE